MTTVPLPTFVPQDSWYNLTTGNYNPSVADSVPDISYLRPSGSQDGIVGPLDGAVIFLAGTATTMDGGQRSLMWDADSLDADDGQNIFCPFALTTTPGRWVSISTRSVVVNANVVATRTIVAGTTDNVTASLAPFIQVFVKDRAAPGATTVNLPSPFLTFEGQTISIKDAQGDASTYNITVVAPSIDGNPSFVFYADYQDQNFTWNGTEWSVT